jgi:hypothetical protein
MLIGVNTRTIETCSSGSIIGIILDGNSKGVCYSKSDKGIVILPDNPFDMDEIKKIYKDYADTITANTSQV